MLVTQLLQNQRGGLRRELPIGPVPHSGSFFMMLAHLIDEIPDVVGGDRLTRN